MITSNADSRSLSSGKREDGFTKNKTICAVMAILLIAVPAIYVSLEQSEATIGDKFVYDGLNFEVTSEDSKEVKVIADSTEYSGNITIPPTARNSKNGITYNVTSIGDNAFEDCNALKSITIPDSITSFGNGAFQYCSGLTSITIPDSVTSIGYNAFLGCEELTAVTIPDGVTSINDGTFSACSGLTAVTIPDGVTSIGKGAFQYCSGLTSITIPDSVTSIGEYAFKDSGLTSIYVNPSEPPTLGVDVFEGCSSSLIIDVPYGSGNAYKAADNWSAYSGKLIDTLVSVPESVTEYIYDGTEKICVQGSGPYAVGGVNNGTDAGNYTVILTLESGHDLIWMDSHEGTDKSIPWSIAKKQITVSGITALNKAYDGTTKATLVYDDAVIEGLVSGESLCITAMGTFVDANPGVGKTVNITNITLSGAYASNYVLAETGQQTTTTADIIAMGSDDNVSLTVIFICVVAVILFMILTAKIE